MIVPKFWVDQHSKPQQYVPNIPKWYVLCNGFLPSSTSAAQRDLDCTRQVPDHHLIAGIAANNQLVSQGRP